MHSVAIIGLLPAQAHIIEREFKSRLRMTFWDAQRTATLKPLCSNNEVVFMRTKHANHQVYQCLKQYKANIVHVNGGMDSLKQAIEGYLNDETNHA